MRILESTNQKGFTLIELMIVISIVAILSAVTWINFSTSSQQSRDSKRQTDLKALQAAIESYKKENGQYPVGCPVGTSANGWSGEKATNYACSDGTSEYILGLSPDYISVLPKDPKLNGTDSGYVYRTNALRNVYKLKAQRTVEADTITFNHPLKSCDLRLEHSVSPNFLNTASQDPRVIGWCGRVIPGNEIPVPCRSNSEYWTKSYGLWGGLAPLRILPAYYLSGFSEYATDPLGTLASDAQRNTIIQDTTVVICK